MARSILEERKDHVLKSHDTTLPRPIPVNRVGWIVGHLGSPLPDYPKLGLMGQYGAVVGSEPPLGLEPPVPGVEPSPGAAVRLSNVVCRSRAGDAPGVPGAAGISLDVPPGQSVALLSQPRAAATELFDVVAGLARPLAGQVWVDGVAVDRLAGSSLDRYHARRGLLTPRFPLLPSLSVADNVLAALLAGRVDGATRTRAARLLELTGGSRLAGPVDRLQAEDQWRIMIARALVPSPRLVLAEDPASSLDPRSATSVLDVLMDAHATFGFTLLFTADRLSTAIRCQRQVSVADGTVAEDQVASGDDAWTRSRIDRIG